MPHVSINSGQFLSRAHGNFEGQNKVSESSIIIINYCIIIIIINVFFLSWRDSPLVGLGLLIHEGLFFLDHTRHTTVGRTPLDE